MDKSTYIYTFINSKYKNYESTTAQQHNSTTAQQHNSTTAQQQRLNPSILKLLSVILFFTVSNLIFEQTGYAQGPAKNCGTFTPDYHITSNTSLTALGLGGGINNKTFILDADLVIDTVVNFNNCLFKVAPNKRIQVTAQQYVYFVNCNLYSCTDRWYGIEVINNNAMLNISYSTIENALNGVLMNSKTNLNTLIYKNDFFNNHVGILIQGASTFSNDINFGNKFHGSVITFKPSFYIPFDKLPAYGIKIEGTGFTQTQYDIGNWFVDAYPIVTPNEFYNLYISGIYMDVASTLVHGAKFYDFYDIPASYPYSYAPVEGAGITSYSTDLKVWNTSSDPYPQNSFDDLEYGIYIKNFQGGSYSWIEDASFQSCATHSIYGNFYVPGPGFVALENDFNLEQTNSNNFYNISKPFNGIYLDGTNGIYDISDNTFHSFTASGATAVSANQVYMNALGAGSPNNPQFGTIYYNNFYNSVANSSSLYIANHYGAGGKIMGNTFNPDPSAGANPPTFHWQMGLFDDRNLLAIHNTFNWAHSNDNIHCQGNFKVNFCENDLNQSIYQNFHAVYENQIDLAKTNFGIADYGLLLSKVGNIDPIIGQQYLKENCWPFVNFIIQAKNEALSPPNILASKFTVNPIWASCFWPFFSPVGWFVSSNDTTRNHCEEEPVPQGLNRPYDDLSWESKYIWYDIISDRSPINDFETDFMFRIVQTGIPNLVKDERRLNEYLLGDQATIEQLELLRSQMQDKKSAIEDIMRQYKDGIPSLADSMAVAGMMDVLDSMKNEYANQLQEYGNTRESKVTSLIAKIQGQSYSSKEENAYKNYLMMIAKCRLKNADMEEMHTSADELVALDEVSYGPAVRKAHHFLTADRYTEYLNSIADICSHQQPQEISAPTTGQATRTSLDLYKVKKNVYNLTFDQEATTYSLLGINGNSADKGTLSKGENRFDWTRLPVGIYFLKIEGNYQIIKVFIEP